MVGKSHRQSAYTLSSTSLRIPCRNWRRQPAIAARCVLIALCAIVPVGGCATPSWSQAEVKFLETREVHRSYEEVYDGALNAMFSLGITIDHSDKASGVVTGQSGDYAFRSQLQGRTKKHYQVKKVTLLITPRAPQLTQVRMKVLVNEKEQLDRKLMTAIWQRIEREIMLNERPTRRRSVAGR